MVPIYILIALRTLSYVDRPLSTTWRACSGRKCLPTSAMGRMVSITFAVVCSACRVAWKAFFAWLPIECTVRCPRYTAIFL